jgi:hypothetical protein
MKMSMSIPTRLAFAGMAFFFSLSACKKDSGGGSSAANSSYYLSATVNGAAWKANVANDSTPVLAALSGTGSATLVLVLGIQAAGKDSSAFAIAFPANITLNKTIVFNTANYSVAVYAPNATADYETVSGVASDDSLTVTSFDKSTMIIEGTFSGTFYLSTGSGSVKVTNGKFRTPYVLDASQLPPSNIKI